MSASDGRKASIVADAFQSYINMVTGVTKTTQEKASATARALLKQAGLEDVAAEASERVAKLAEEIINASRTNRELMEHYVTAEVDKAAARLGFARADEVQALRDEVASLSAQLDEARANEARMYEARAAAAAKAAPAKKAPAKKAPAKKAPAKGTSAAKKAPAKKAPAKKAPAKKAAATMTSTKKATATKSAGRKPPRKTAATAESVSSGEK
jgi:polyhydroxyalkanoate synthesis regulator phasin